MAWWVVRTFAAEWWPEYFGTLYAELAASAETVVNGPDDRISIWANRSS